MGEWKMKKLLVILALPTAVYAQPWIMKDALVKDVWANVQKRVPIQSQVCEQIQVPIYQEAKPNGGAVLLGAIIGNAIGRAAGVDGGQTAGTVIGGIAGAEISKNDREIERFETREQCKTVTDYQLENKLEYRYSIIKFEYEGKEYQVKFNK